MPLLCLNHGLKDPSSSKPYEIRRIEEVVEHPSVIEVVKGYANGEIPRGASQAAVWHLNSRVSWQELAAKKTGSKRNKVRYPYFSTNEIRAAIAIAHEALARAKSQSPSSRGSLSDQAGNNTPKVNRPTASLMPWLFF